MKMNKTDGFIILSGLLISHLAFATPDGWHVAAGDASIFQAGATTTIHQNSSSAVINWRDFDTKSNESVIFNQPNSNSTVLNRITSGLPTNFAGSLTANGKVFMVNPAGMVFAKGASINAASFITTTADIKDQDFMNGQYKFAVPSESHVSEASIINNGSITAKDYGLVALIAPNVINAETGIITASEGNVILATGKAFILDFNQDGLINFDASALISNGDIENAGKISAYDGTVVMSTHTVADVVNNMTSMGNVTEANNMTVNNHHEVVLSKPKEPYNVGTITNTGDVSTKYVYLTADKGINLGGSIKSDGWLLGMIEARTQKGDIIWSGSLSGPDDIKLYAPQGAIQVKSTAVINADGLYIYSPLAAPDITAQRKGVTLYFINDNPDLKTQAILSSMID